MAKLAIATSASYPWLMNVSLTPELERIVNENVSSGLYGSASEVVREALRLLHERQLRLADLRREIQIGIDDLDNGRSHVADHEFYERIKQEGRARLAGRKR